MFLAHPLLLLTSNVLMFLHNMDRLNHAGLSNHMKTDEKVHKNTDKRNQGMSLYFVVFVCGSSLFWGDITGDIIIHMTHPFVILRLLYAECSMAVFRHAHMLLFLTICFFLYRHIGSRMRDIMMGLPLVLCRQAASSEKISSLTC